MLVRPSPQDVSIYQQWEKRVVKWLLHFPRENPVDLCEVCIMHVFIEKLRLVCLKWNSTFTAAIITGTV